MAIINWYLNTMIWETLFIMENSINTLLSLGSKYRITPYGQIKANRGHIQYQEFGK